jgi:putative tricarboxylic transport membrane protein
LAIGWFGQRLFSLIVHVPLKLVLPSVIFFCCMGAWLQGGGAFGIMVMVVFGLLGVLAKQLDYSFVTFLIGFVIGPNLELSMRQSIAMTDLEPRLFIDHPVASLFLLATVFMVLRFSGLRIRRPRTDAGTPNQRREEIK